MTVQQQNAPTPPGSIPKEIPRYVVLGAALLVVVAVALSSMSSTKSSAKSGSGAGSPLAAAPSKADIDRAFQNLDAEKARLLAAQKLAREAHYTPAAAGMPGPPQPIYATPLPPPEKPAIDTAMEAKERLAPYAGVFVEQTSRRAPVSQPTLQAEVVPIKDAGTVGEPSSPSTTSVPRFRLVQGTVIEAVLANRLEGSFQGPVKAHIAVNVYSSDLSQLVIPQGSQVIGEAHSVSSPDQRRLALTFQRVILPNGSDIHFERVSGLDQAGGTGIAGKVNHRYISTFGTSIAIGLLAGLSSFGTGSLLTADGVDIYRQRASTQLGQDATRILERQLNRLPVITIPEGSRIRIFLNADLSLPAYKSAEGNQ